MFINYISGTTDGSFPASLENYDIEIQCKEAVLRFYQRQTDRLLGKQHSRNENGLRARFIIPTTRQHGVLISGNSN